MTRLALVLIVAVLLLPANVGALEPGEELKDPVLEARARALSKVLRCVVCQNQSIDDSNAGLARDLRLLVRRRLEAGDSDRQVLDYVTARYGDFVLLRPPVKPKTYLLWFGPALLVLAGGAVVAIGFRRRRHMTAPESAPLSTEERQRLDHLMERDG